MYTYLSPSSTRSARRRGASTSGSGDGAGKPLPPPQPRSLSVCSTRVALLPARTLHVRGRLTPAMRAARGGGTPAGAGHVPTPRRPHQGTRASAEAEGNDLCNVILEQHRRPHLPVPPLASSSPTHCHPLLFFIAIAEGCDGVGDGEGGDGLPRLPCWEEAAVRRRSDGGGSARKGGGGSVGVRRSGGGGVVQRAGVAAAMAARRGRAAAARVAFDLYYTKSWLWAKAIVAFGPFGWLLAFAKVKAG
uniref:Uncharacterized protein n=1 Tax=Oryza glumipatula TaxID=40148 RepID=A0A0E0AIB2_9ORYZ